MSKNRKTPKIPLPRGLEADGPVRRVARPVPCPVHPQLVSRSIDSLQPDWVARPAIFPTHTGHIKSLD